MKKKNDNVLNYIIYALIFLIVLTFIFIFMGGNETPTDEEKKNSYSFTLTGGDVTLKYKEEYQEPGYSYIDENNNDLTSSVQVINNVNNRSPGEYQIIYRYNDKVLTRKVTVLEPESYDLTINYTLDKNEITNTDVTITYEITGETFSKVLMPDGKVYGNTKGSITVNKNGSYKIVAYNVKNQEYIEEINITNIDKEKPTGTCTATLNQDNTVLSVDAKDEHNITKYEYFDNGTLLNSNESNKYTSSNKTSNTLTVKVYDEAGNVSELKCKIVDNRYYDPIKPPSGENVIFREETDTLKVYISKIGGYYLTRIWAKDAYSQLNKAASPEYGKNLYKPLDLLTRSMNQNNLQNKLMVGFNGSGFYLKGTFDAASVNKYPPYDKTEVGTIVINNGKVVRNAYNKAVKQWYLTGITKDNKMVIFEDNMASSSAEIEAKQKWSQTVINSGVRNTFNFAGPVIKDGKRLSSFSSSMPDRSNNSYKGLTMICQINENNYVLFTSTHERRNTAIDKFLSLGCKTATNLDGGGSVALFYKSKNSRTFTKVVGGGRALPAAGYFNE